MENFLFSYKNLYEDSEKWNYYNDCKSYHFDFNKVFRKEFFENYFKIGLKGEVFNFNSNLTIDRITHTISTFFLGIYLKDKLELLELESLEPDFRYLWFLSCLFHDAGYEYEGDKEKYPVKKYTLKYLKKNKNILNDNYLLTFWSPQTIPDEFDLKTIQKYYEYCRKEKCFVNHGFIGGLFLYDGLLKNFKNIKKKAIEEKEKSGSFGNLEEPFEFGNLYWNETDLKFYQQAAEVILVHNIWFCTKEKDEKLYKKYELSNLNIIGKPECRIRLKKSPLLFLLALADTIEPLKAFPNIAPECLLEKIAITKIDNGFQIQILDDCLYPKSWFKKILEMKEWLDVTVNYGDSKTLFITLNHTNNE